LHKSTFFFEAGKIFLKWEYRGHPLDYWFAILIACNINEKRTARSLGAQI